MTHVPRCDDCGSTDDVRSRDVDGVTRSLCHACRTREAARVREEQRRCPYSDPPPVSHWDRWTR